MVYDTNSPLKYIIYVSRSCLFMGYKQGVHLLSISENLQIHLIFSTSVCIIVLSTPKCRSNDVEMSII